jgi:DNA-binding HxlR family transcriptional regulator
MADAKPVENALELLGRRWALRLVWELRRSTLAFSELRERTGISPSVLSARLDELVRAGAIGSAEMGGSWPGSSTTSTDGPSRQGYPR